MYSILYVLALLCLILCRAAEEPTFNIAIITAGALRSFAFTARSWENYLITQPSSSSSSNLRVKLFAHVLHDDLRCQIASIGLSHLRRLATVLEIGEVSKAPTGDLPFPESAADTLARIPTRFARYFPYLQQDGSYKGHSRGNVIDMHRRRARAFSLALQYGREKSMLWDAVLFTRLDTAFYSPRSATVFQMHLWTCYHSFTVLYVLFCCYRLNLYQMTSNLLASRRNTSNTSQNHMVYSPPACNFHWGICDRFMFLLFDDASRIFVSLTAPIKTYISSPKPSLF